MTDRPFAKSKDSHSYLLRQCVGQNLTSFPPLSRDAAVLGDVSNRIISRAYFDSILAPLLVEHFDATVDLRLAYYAAVESQGLSIDRSPVKRGGPLNVPQIQPLSRSHTEPHRDNGKTGKGTSTRTVFHPDDHEDDSEPEIELKNETRRVLHLPETQQVPQVHREERWTGRENEACLEIIRQVLRGVRGKRLRWVKVGEIAKRLKTEHHINRSCNAPWGKWCIDWSHLPEFEKRKLPRAGDTDDNRVSKEVPRQWDDKEIEICLELMRQIWRVDRDLTSDWRKCTQISQRLKTEHNIHRPCSSIQKRWRADWRHRPEFESLRRKGENDDIANINKKKERRQGPHRFEEEEEDWEEEEWEEEEDEDEEEWEEAEQEQEDDGYQEYEEEGDEDSVRPAADPVAPALAIASRKSTAWSAEEDAACVSLMKEVCTLPKYAAIASTEKRFEVVANRMKLEGGFERNANGVRLQWNRRLREASKFEDRSERKLSSKLITSALGQRIKSSSSPAQYTEASNLRSERPSSARRNTARSPRGVSKSDAKDKRTTNNLFQQSRDISVDVISQFVNAGKWPLQFKSTWKQILEHRRQNGMEASGSEDNPPYPLEEALGDAVTSGKARKVGAMGPQAAIDSALVQNINDEIRILTRFAESSSD